MPVQPQEVHGKSLYLPLDFAINLKLVLKMIFDKFECSSFHTMENDATTSVFIFRPWHQLHWTLERNMLFLKIFHFCSISSVVCLWCAQTSVVSDFLWPHGLQPASSSIHGILLARILEWVAISSSRGSSQPRDGTLVSYVSLIGRWVLYH